MSVSPTCDRSALHVVQLQMNAFRYNDNATNDGIRTARAFSSPSNRRTIGSVDRFITIFDTPQYSPMLTYDSVEYSVPRIDGDTAKVDVVTREAGNVTGRYEFWLRKVPDDGENETGDGPGGCWMTSGVMASLE
jgi:hypothetical protein